MTHTPPVPPGNQSPYPIQEAPHAASASASAENSDNADGWAPDTPRSGWSLGRIVGAAAGVGAIAIGVAAVLFPRETVAEKPKGKKKK